MFGLKNKTILTLVSLSILHTLKYFRIFTTMVDSLKILKLKPSYKTFFENFWKSGIVKQIEGSTQWAHKN